MEFGKVKDMLKISYEAEEGDDPEEVERLKIQAKTNASKSFIEGKVISVTMSEPSKLMIKDAYEKFINNIKSKKSNIKSINNKSIKSGISNSTLENYNSAMSYIKLFISEDKSISELDNSFWNYLQECLIKTPRDYMKTQSLLQKGIQKTIIDNEKTKTSYEIELKSAGQNIELYDKIKIKYQTKILTTLSNTTINKHFSFYKKFMIYLNDTNLMKNSMKIETLEEDDSEKETFLYKELKELFNYKSKIKRKDDDDDEEYQNIFKFAFLSGMRRGEILKITKDSIVKANDILCIDIQEAKTKESIRLVPISEDMKTIMEIQFKKSKNGYLFFDNDIRINNVDKVERTIGKRLNRRIDRLLKDNNYVDKSVKSFHSLRGNCIQELYKQYELKEIGSELYIKMLVGHKAVKNLTFNTYNKGQVSIEILRDCIYKISLNLVSGATRENVTQKIKVSGEFEMYS